MLKSPKPLGNFSSWPQTRDNLSAIGLTLPERKSEQWHQNKQVSEREGERERKFKIYFLVNVILSLNL